VIKLLLLYIKQVIAASFVRRTGMQGSGGGGESELNHLVMFGIAHTG